MTDEEWDGWEEWLAHPLSEKFKIALEELSEREKANWVESLWAKPECPNEGRYPHIKARSEVYGELSKLDREILETLLESDT